ARRRFERLGSCRSAQVPDHRTALLRRLHCRGDGASAGHFSGHGREGAEAGRSLAVQRDGPRQDGMTPERWCKVGELFHQAMDVPANERMGWVDRVCGGDAELRMELCSLLESDQAAGEGFVQRRVKSAVVSFHKVSSRAGRPKRVGPYRLIRELGRGGMGTVYLAERADEQYQTKVAIKLVRPGMDTDFILQRFRRERQILAHLQHPHIARLLDGGATDDGLPYIVMEYIEGSWITEYCRSRALGI